MSNRQIHVLIADSHDLFRQGLSSLLTRQSGIEVVAEVSEISQIGPMIESVHPDLVLMEIHMRGSDGLHTVMSIIEAYPSTNISILTASEDDEDVLAAGKLGIKGYLLKNSSLEELVRAIHALSQGGAYFSSSMFTKVLQEFTHLARRRDLQEAKGIDALTEREKDVLRLVARGATNRDIAGELVITENTVKVHLRNILDKLQLKNRQQAAAYAVQEGLISRMIPGSIYGGSNIRSGNGNTENGNSIPVRGSGYGVTGGRGLGGLRVMPSPEEPRAARTTLGDYKVNMR